MAESSDLNTGHVSVYGINGEWMPEADVAKLKLGDTVKLEITVYVAETGKKLLDPADKSTTKAFAKLKTTGVTVIG